ncbi:MAG: pyridoxamine 5'-phosphate oxidase family protein [Rhodospirillales bacterium]|nr:MAG: pyridoxamine 5'-phosphate oxidase family protein [Rhodospirillales bacterium]
MTGGPAELAAATQCRRLIRGIDRAGLATTAGRGKAGVEGPWPYASLVLVACDHDASPLLLISDLADHTRNLRADSRVALLFDGTGGLDDPLTGPRVSLQGKAEMVVDEAMMGRYLRRHPSAERYAEFADFHLVRVRPRRAHLVAGFGKVEWVEGGDLVVDTTAMQALCRAEKDIVDQLNSDHAEWLDRIAATACGELTRGWRATGVDPEGVDLRRGAIAARADFPGFVRSPEDACKAILQLATGAGGGGGA